MNESTSAGVDLFDDTVRQLVAYCNSSVVRKPFESEWLVRRSLVDFQSKQFEQSDATRRAGAAAHKQQQQRHAAQQAQLYQEIGKESMRCELESMVHSARQSESHWEQQCQIQRQKLQQAEQLLAEAQREKSAQNKEEPLVIERYLRTALGNEKKALQDEKARNSNLLREQEKQWLQRMEALRKEENQAWQGKRLQVEADVQNQRQVHEQQLQDLQVKLEDALEKAKQTDSLTEAKLAAKEREWQDRHARAKERAQEQVLEMMVSEMDELQAINDANMQALQLKCTEELDASAEELRKAAAFHCAELREAHANHKEVHERDAAWISELTSSLARSRIVDEDGDLSSPSKKQRLEGPDEGQMPKTPGTVRRRLVSKKRVMGAEKDQRINLAGPLPAKVLQEIQVQTGGSSASSTQSTPRDQGKTPKRSAADFATN